MLLLSYHASVLRETPRNSMYTVYVAGGEQVDAAKETPHFPDTYENEQSVCVKSVLLRTISITKLNNMVRFNS